MTSVEQVARLLSEIPYIEANPGISLSEVSRVFGVSEAQVAKDVTTALFCGLPGGFPTDLIDVDQDVMEDEGSLYMTNPTPLGRPLRLSGAEAASLQVALMAVRAVADDQTVRDIDALMSKISGESGGVDLRLASGNERIRTLLRQAITDADRVELTYDGQARGTTTHPLVDPHQIITRDGAAYLTAYDVSGAGWRTYRMDRIADVRPTGDPADSHGPAPSPDSWAASLAAGQTVQITVGHDAAWIAESYPVSSVEKVDEGLRISLSVVDPAWLVRLLLGLGDQVRCVDPPQYAAAARDLAQATLEAYETIPACVGEASTRTVVLSASAGDDHHCADGTQGA